MGKIQHLPQSVQELLWISMKPLESRLQQMQEEGKLLPQTLNNS